MLARQAGRQINVATANLGMDFDLVWTRLNACHITCLSNQLCFSTGEKLPLAVGPARRTWTHSGASGWPNLACERPSRVQRQPQLLAKYGPLLGVE